MAFSLKLVIFIQLFLAIFASARLSPFNPKQTIFEHLKIDQGGSSTCWDSLFELQYCSGEVVLFFMNGETYLGPTCCSAIRTIEHYCWPSMLSTLGYTSEEGDILRGYCDEAEPDHGNGGAGITPLPSGNATTIPVKN